MIVLRAKDGGAVVGKISEADFQFMVDQLEEESEEDADYYITMATIEMMERNGGSENLMNVLREAVGDSEGVELSWSTE
jgi:primase-polymerase (primpol)-like protein